jgi:Na+/melibiose symporter-like transporter
LFFYLVVVAIVVRTFITFYEVPSSALAPELTDDYDQRTSFLSYRLFFAWYGGLTMLALAYAVFLKPDATHKIGQLNQTGYSHYGITAAVIMFAAILISAWGTHKFIPYFRVPEERRVPVMQNIREMFAALSNRPFLVLMSSGLLFYLATGLFFALNIYLQTYFWALSNIQIFVLTLSSFISVLISFLIALPLSRRFGKKSAAIYLFAFGLVISSAPVILRLIGWFPPNGAPVLLPLLFAFATVGLALSIASSILLVSMLADVVEDNELKTGRRSEGLFFAGNSFLQKAVSGLGVFASGLVLAAVHFPQNAIPGHVDPVIIRNLALVYLPLVMVLYGVAMAIIGLYPISRESHAENLRKLAAETAQAAPEL